MGGCFQKSVQTLHHPGCRELRHFLCYANYWRRRISMALQKGEAVVINTRINCLVNRSLTSPQDAGESVSPGVIEGQTEACINGIQLGWGEDDQRVVLRLEGDGTRSKSNQILVAILTSYRGRGSIGRDLLTFFMQFYSTYSTFLLQSLILLLPVNFLPCYHISLSIVFIIFTFIILYYFFLYHFILQHSNLFSNNIQF